MTFCLQECSWFECSDPEQRPCASTKGIREEQMIEMKSVRSSNHVELGAAAGFSLLKCYKCDSGYVLRQGRVCAWIWRKGGWGGGATEIIEKRAEFSSSRGPHFLYWAKCNGPFVHISPGVDESVVGTSAIIQMRLNGPPWVEDKDAGSQTHPDD